MKRLSIIPFVLYMLCCLNVNATDSECLWGSKTLWQKMATVLYAHGVDTTGMGITTLVNADILNEAALDLAKTFGVKSELSVTYTKQELIGNVICQYMQLKYTKQNEKHAYYRVRYSTDEDDYAKFIMAYPDSRHANEIQWKMNCMKAYWSWFEAMTADACRLAYLYSKIVDNNVYEGFVSEHRDIVQYIQTVEDWELLMQTRVANEYADCDDFTRFSQAHIGHLTGYNFFIYDSIRNCEHNQAWNAAKEANTIAAYRDYLLSYPAGEHAYTVKAKIRDYEDWMDTRDRNNYAAYQEYCENHPYGDSIEAANNAKKRIEDADWQRIKDTKNWMDLSDYIKKYPDGYYSLQADERMQNMWGSAAINMNTLFENVGFSAAKDSGIVFLSNTDNRKHDLTFDLYLKGRVGKKLVKSKTIKPGEYCHFKIRNGRYEVVISSPSKNVLREITTPTHGDMDVENFIYYFSYYTYDMVDTNLSHKMLDKKYSDPMASKRASDAVEKVVAMEWLKLASTDERINISNGVCTIFMDGYIDLKKSPTEVVSGELLKESKKAFYNFVESTPDSQLTLYFVGKAGLGLRVVSVDSYSGIAEIVEFTANEMKTFANKLGKMLE